MESIQKDVKKGNVQVTVEKGTAEKGIKNVAEKGAIRKVIKDSRSEILVCVGDSKNDQKGPEVGVAKKGIQAGVEKDSVQVAIEKMLKRGKKGQLYFSTDFRGVASEGAVKMALSRLNKLGKIKRLTHGIYLMPVIDPVLGEIMPSMEEIAEAVAIKERIRIRPAGALALYKLGHREKLQDNLKDTETNKQKEADSLVYLTNGTSRKIRIGNTNILFKATRARKLSGIGKYSSLAILALEGLGTDNIDAGIKERLRGLLLEEDPKKLQHDLKLATAKVIEFVADLLRVN